MAGQFDGLRVVVTGGTGGLGSGVVDRLIAEGATVRVPVFHERELERFAFRDHDRVELVMDVNLSESSAVDRVYAGFDGLWASVHVAGGFGMGSISGDDQPALFDKMMSMNAKTAFLCSRAAARAMGDGGGRIVNIVARPALYAREGANMAAYAMSKAAVAAMTEALSVELADNRIWVNAVAPSIMDTPANRESMPDADHAKWPKVDEVAATIAYLASPENAVTTGGLVPVYGCC
jgi:NAD(P)-dependent dehydrogenase (short-subunit alcohol dehydrogenase family)